MANKKIKHNYQSIEGWFNMEQQYLELLNHCPIDGIFVELGCFKGKSTSFIVTEILNQNKKINFTTIDSFEGHTNSSDTNEVQAYNGIENIYNDFSNNIDHLSKYIKKKGLVDSMSVIKSLSHEGANWFNDGSVDVLFIDAGHSYEAVKKDIEAWLPKMKPNGIIAGHDYNSWQGVKKAVDEKFGTPTKIENDCWFIYLEAKF